MVPPMILHPGFTSRQPVTVRDATSAAPGAAVPAWLRAAVPDAKTLGSHGIEDVALAAGAALGALDAVVRRQERWAGAWRQRLAVTAAAVTARQAGRMEDENALRDAVLLTRPGDDVGPAGRLLLAWHRLATRPAEELLTRRHLAAVLDAFGYAPEDAEVGALADDVRQRAAGTGTVGMLAGASMVAGRHGFGHAVGAWLADALLAQRLGWSHAVPLQGGEAGVGTGARSRRSAGSTGVTNVETDAERAKSLLAAQALAAIRAIDLSTELGRRAERLLGVAPKLRAKAADAVVERLLSDDAIVASDRIAGISDRGLRRLFDRLVELGALRELSGRPTFRIYGL